MILLPSISIFRRDPHSRGWRGGTKERCASALRRRQERLMSAGRGLTEETTREFLFFEATHHDSKLETGPKSGKRRI
jgi:hypothetical protein